MMIERVIPMKDLCGLLLISIASSPDHHNKENASVDKIR
jgi:hypothetical protein